ncbi:MAG TPA: molybdopterin-dependent oxidoreductase [Verrucomicrobiae bacterium]|nr:molybdopterin-dependent oxidoreductase [Verrucomicrobiae bacterium]
MPEPRGVTAAGLTRRAFLKRGAATAVSSLFVVKSLPLIAADTVQMPFANGLRKLAQFPQKRPLIVMSWRPPQLETPFEVFNESLLTPNDAFFVRYHLSGIPTSIDPDQFRVNVKGSVNRPLELSMADIKNKFEPVEFIAVNQCSGNGRAFTNPRVGGGQSGNGTMGNAKWKGARLRDVLHKAGVKAGAKQVTFNGLDKGVTDKVPDFVKALEIDHALHEDTLLGYEMNGEPLPMLNGFPLRLIVPGHYGTYWVKHVNEITVVDEPFAGFWMVTGYRIPDNDCACVPPGTKPDKTRPIGRYDVRSFFTSLTNQHAILAGKTINVRGIAFDGGYGITQVLFSDDGGENWREAQLGKDMGKYSFREWTIPFTPKKPGMYVLKVKATNRVGQSQPMEPLWNPAGYMRNVVETVRIMATA